MKATRKTDLMIDTDRQNYIDYKWVVFFITMSVRYYM